METRLRIADAAARRPRPAPRLRTVPPPGGRNGMTLLEILVALSLLSGGLLLVLRANHGTLNALRQTRESLQIGLGIREHMAGAAGRAVIPTDPVLAPPRGRLEDAADGRIWRHEIRPASFAVHPDAPTTPRGELLEIRMQIRPEGRRPARAVHHTGVVYVTAPAPAP